MENMKKIQGQLTHEQFLTSYPQARINAHAGTAITLYGKYTVNYWHQHSDGSWTNYDCKTK